MDAIAGTTKGEFLELAELGSAASTPQNVAGVVNLDEPLDWYATDDVVRLS